jgi:ribosome-binding protein aMBF1 (putative translation factor)
LATLADCIALYEARQMARSDSGDVRSVTGEDSHCEAENLVLSTDRTESALSVADVLPLYRVNAGLSQNALARLAQIDVAHVNRLEHGKADASRFVILALARALELSPYKRARLMEAAGYCLRAQEAS